MTDKNIQIRDLSGNNLFPKTKGTMVFNTNGDNLGAVEAGAQVNVLEGVQLNGTDIAIANKKANIVLPAAVAYTIAKADTAEEGYAATYQLAADGVAFGTKINIPKDMVVSAGEVKTCTVADQPVAGYKVGDIYIDLTIANAAQSHLYILASSLIDVYTAADATIVIEDHAIKVNLTELGKTFQAKLSDTQLAAANSGITAAKVTDYDSHVDNGDIHVTAELKSTWNAKQNALSTEQLAAANSGITAAKVGDYDTHVADNDIHVTAELKTTWSGKQDAITSANKLAASLIADDATHRFVSDTEKSTWNAKQDAISDLATIRENATAGAGAATTIAGYGDIVTHDASEFATAAQGTKADTALQQSNVVSTYSATGTAPINGTGVAAAIADLITYVEITD